MKRKLIVKRKHWVLLAVLLIAILVLSGCGVPRAGVDVTTSEPSGPWQTFVVWPLAMALVWIHNMLENLGMPYAWGFAIIAFTIIIKIVTFPLTLTQLRGMQAQKDIQPRLKELQKKYGKDRERMTQEQMKLYKEAGVNPMSGCLPLLVQMPILFGLYAALVALGPALEGARFFWIPDLGFPVYTQGLSWIPEFFRTGQFGLLAAYLVLPALLVVSQLAMQKWMTPTPAGGEQAGMTGQVTYLMTAMFGFFTLQVPAGLTLYWVTSNLIQMLQQWFITSDRFRSKPKPVTADAAPGGQIVDGEVVEADTDSNEDASPPAEDKKHQSSSKKGKRRKAKKR